MTRQTKFVKGARIETLAEAITEIEEGRWLYMRDKPLHPGFLTSMTVRAFASAAKGGYLHYAEPRAEMGGFEFQITAPAPETSIELCIAYMVTDWGGPPCGEIDLIGVTMEVAAHVWRPASKDLDAWARDWADQNVETLIDDARLGR